MLSPAQTVSFPVTTGGATVIIKTVSVTDGLIQPFPLTTRVYIPELIDEAFVIIGF